MQPRRASIADIPELVRLRAVALDSLGVDPGLPQSPWRHIARTWFEQRITGHQDWHCLVIGGGPGEPLLASGIAWVTYHLPGPRWPDGRRGYVDGMVTDSAARGRGYARKILDGLVTWLEESGIHYIQLHASPDGMPLYKSAGFTDARYPAMDLITPATPVVAGIGDRPAHG
ncbi:MAG TPA: GNAT family N-acetyltransferase [Streptosporangiaceae bacterium]